MYPYRNKINYLLNKVLDWTSQLVTSPCWFGPFQQFKFWDGNYILNHTGWLGIAAIHVNYTPIMSRLFRPHSPSDPDDKGQFGFRWHIKVPHFACHTGQADLTPVHLPVLLVVLLCPFEDQLPGHFAGLMHKNTGNFSLSKTAL